MISSNSQGRPGNHICDRQCGQTEDGCSQRRTGHVTEPSWCVHVHLTWFLNVGLNRCHYRFQVDLVSRYCFTVLELNGMEFLTLSLSLSLQTLNTGESPSSSLLTKWMSEMLCLQSRSHSCCVWRTSKTNPGTSGMNTLINLPVFLYACVFEKTVVKLSWTNCNQLWNNAVVFKSHLLYRRHLN